MRGGLTKDNKNNTFESLDEAYEAMEDDDEIVSIFLNKKEVYTAKKL